MELGQLRLQSLHDRHGRVLVKVMDHQYFQWTRARALDHSAQSGNDVLALVVNGHHHAEDGRRCRIAQMRPASISSRTQGMTSSSISSSVVVASNPSTSRAFLPSGPRTWRSCSYGGSETRCNGRPGPCTLRQITSASSRTVVERAVDRLKDSFNAFSDSIARR